MDATPPLAPTPVPPPLAAVPVFSRQDADHLRALSIAHYVFGGLIALLSLFFILYIVLGISALSGHLPMNSGGQPSSPAEQRLFGWVFTVLGTVFVAGGLGMAAFVIHAGRCVARRRRYLLCLIVAGLLCLFAPLGTVLGVFTLVTLLRPQVKAAFDAAGTAA
ncbi:MULTISPECIES: hypothetical protein [Stenotrophomonas]|uniref:Transmembrane protein n=1 Tax=Stenotrophomonas hibiscicola TaxID=86189 RepID=A0ABV0CCC6_9GAMM|nr:MULTISPECIES: hypothetical protein [Stenotrophomonas]EQM84754.1 membrane protein [Stenotrophomonas maltophilia MF89]MBA0263330.1 hypothetical protein [Stenotrophomonas maltophilia]MBA0327634.1 hypothetical protein [Stenotrophomonas maltophilia]MBA0467758.1 hypothetical protein [Stenotrophomonas maltophilia]MBA0477312.1 hypothetical protein [Stenotrophomonas maltophilia]